MNDYLLSHFKFYLLQVTSLHSQQSLDQHLNSPAHDSYTSVYECDECDRSFGSQRTLEQYLNSARHKFGMRSVL